MSDRPKRHLDGRVTSDRVGVVHPTDPHLLDAAARYVTAHASATDVPDLLAALDLKEPA